MVQAGGGHKYSGGPGEISLTPRLLNRKSLPDQCDPAAEGPELREPHRRLDSGQRRSDGWDEILEVTMSLEILKTRNSSESIMRITEAVVATGDVVFL